MEVFFMSDAHNTRNYFAHGGSELVIGGRLTFLPGASVEGADDLFDLPEGGGAAQLPALPDSEATTVANLKADFNALLAALRTAGVLSTTAPAATEPETTDPETPAEGTEGGGT
jgi:hypothetical protein